MKLIHASISALVLFFIIAPEGFAQRTDVKPPAVLKIHDAVELALERNTSITQAVLSVSSSEARVTSAFGTFLPTINLSGGYTRYIAQGSVVIEGTPIEANRPDDFYRAGANASILLFDGFGRTATYNAAQYSYAAAELGVTFAKRQVVWQVRHRFLNALRARQIVDLREVELQTAQEQLLRIEGLVEGAVAVIATQYAQEVEVANAELMLEQARTDYLVARTSLSNLMNVDPVHVFEVSPDGLLETIDSTEMVRRKIALGSFEDLFERQLQSRSDIVASRATVEAAEASLKAAKAGYYPTVSATLGWGWNRSGGINSSDGTLSLNLQYPLFEGFRTDERVQLAENEYANAQIELRRLELQARSELQQAFARLEGAERALSAAEKVVKSARQSRLVSDERFKVGLENYSDYLTANTQFFKARINQIDTLFNYRMALYEIEYLSGQ